jgi:hypothetical protein
MILNPKQEIHLRNVRQANVAWRAAKIDAAARAKILAAQEVDGYLLAMDREVRMALEAGVPLSQIHRVGLGTTNVHTARASLARTAPSSDNPLAERGSDPLAGRYSYDRATGELTVTLAGEPFERAANELDWDITQALAVGLNVAVFDVDPNGSQLVPAIAPTLLHNTDWLPQYGNRHPVIVWSSVPANAAEALGWVQKKLAA